MLPSRKSRKRPRPSLRRSTLVALAVVGAGLLGFAAFLLFKADLALENMSLSPKNTAASKTDAALLSKPVSFLLAGVDSRTGSGGTMNTDVLMLVSLNPERRSATIVSIPRDFQMKPKAYGLPSQKVNYYYAYYYNQNQETAISKTKELFGNMFNVPIDYMAVIDFDGFREVVDELNGLEINVDMDMRYVDTEDETNINLKKGLQTLNGKETLDFLRYRKSNRGTEDSSDIARNERQQIVLNKLLDKLTSLGGITQWGGVLEIAGNNVKTDIPADTLRKFILNFQKLRPQQIEFIHLDGRWDSPYMVIKEEDLSDAVTSLRKQLGMSEDDLTTNVSSATYSSSWSSKFGIDPSIRK